MDLFPALIFYNLEEADDPRVCSRPSYFSRPYLVNIHSEPALIRRSDCQTQTFQLSAFRNRTRLSDATPYNKPFCLSNFINFSKQKMDAYLPYVQLLK